MIRETTSVKVRSAASAAIGSSEVSVMPGDVLDSSTNTRPSSSTTMSTRLTSRHPSTSCTFRAMRHDSSASSSVMRAGAKKSTSPADSLAEKS